MSILRQVWTEEEMAERNQLIGREEAHMADALGMKLEGISLDIIKKITGLSREVIEAL